MLAKIRDILIITTKQDHNNFLNLLGNGSDFGINLKYAVQEKPNGLAEAFLIGEKFIGNENICLALGDNIFYGQSFKDFLNKAKNRDKGATIFGYQVKDPRNFGVVQFDEKQKAISIEEKPKKPKSNFAITGLYFFDNKVKNYAKKVLPSKRGELEITDVIQKYFEQDELYVEDFGRGFAWLDTGTHESLMSAGQFVQVIEQRQGFKIACLEELGYRNGWISKEKLLKIASSLEKTPYGDYVKMISKNSDQNTC